MSARAVEFVETWVSEQIEEMDELPAQGNDTVAKKLVSQCVQAALEENVPATEIQDAFDDLAAFIDNEIEEERERREGRDEDDDETFLDEDEEEDE
jgi:regulator of PEP synthase PpsR (kinase-PPPase family)